MKRLEVNELFFLASSLFGIQFAWTVEFSAGTPFLLSLGISSKLTALVWLAGPLSGLIVQPLIGFWSDNCTLKYGMRRVFIIAGTLLVNASILLIAYSAVLASVFPDPKTAQIVMSVAGFYCLDFSINAVMGAARSLIVDIAPAHQQSEANAWAGRMLSAGTVVGYFVGYLDLPKLFPALGGDQLRVLCLIAVLILSSSVGLTCYFTEEVPLLEGKKNIKWYTAFIEIWKSWRLLPSPIQDICNTQFFVWLGWFPFLFYSTSWIASVQKRNTTQVLDLDTRLGSLGLLFFALVSTAASFLVPYFNHLKPSLGLGKIWAATLVLYAALVYSTLLNDSITFCLFVTASLGLTWATTMWVPFALLGENLALEQPEGYLPLNEVVPKVKPGVVLGLHNMYICLPQLCSTLISMLVFSLEAFKGDEFGWNIRIGSSFMLIGAILSARSSAPFKND